MPKRVLGSLSGGLLHHQGHAYGNIESPKFIDFLSPKFSVVRLLSGVGDPGGKRSSAERQQIHRNVRLPGGGDVRGRLVAGLRSTGLICFLNF